MRLWIGAGLLILGALLFVDRLVPSANVPHLIAMWWPIVLVLFGVGGLIRLASHRPALLVPLAMTILGGALALRTTGVVPSSMDRFILPLLACMAGAGFLGFAAANRRKAADSPVAGRMTSIAESRKISWPHHERSLAQLVSVLSGCAVELPKPDGLKEARLEITAFGSAVDVVVPQGWRIEMSSRNILGRSRNRLSTVETDPSKPILIVESLVIGSGVTLIRP
ncbi:LiaF transmembrane domain-containing protein [Phytohabitans sp. LJ34]|uniref:LiaF transmembrane domain-containing protein n=1 Tax=Phytohabitans sp. LJ34 TaxID=3452217 RepID=UPI003F886CEE